jgi:hypothetical protein
MLQGLQKFALVAIFVILVGCGAGTHSRGQFTGHVVGSTEEQVTSKLGKPADVDAKDPNRPRWIYKGKTFDPDNFNKVDEKVMIIFEKNAEGKLIGKDVIFG